MKNLPKKYMKPKAIIVIICLVFVVSAVCTLSLIHWGNRNDSQATIRTQTSDEQDARADSDAYFAALKACDLYKTNAYSVVRSEITTADINRCKAACLAGISYEFLNQKKVVRQKSPSGDDELMKTDEISYSYGCNGQNQISHLSLVYSYSAHIWKVVNPL